MARPPGKAGDQRPGADLLHAPRSPDGNGLRALMPRLARRAGIEKRGHAHGLRHTHAAELAMEGKPVNLIQAQLGHASLAVTSTYLAHIAPAQLIEAMRSRPAFSV